MPKIADVTKEIATKKTSVTKTETEITKLRAAFKPIATAQQKAEDDAKRERDPKKKKALETLANAKWNEGETILKKIEGLEKALQRFETSIAEAETKLRKLQEGVAAFAKARTDYLAWWPGAKGKLDTLVAGVGAEARAAEKALADCDTAIDAAQVDVALAKATEAEAAATRAEQKFTAVETLIQGWQGKEWQEQRNLSAKNFGVDPADVAVHAGLASRAYATFKLGDEGRAEAKEHLDAANAAATEARTLAAAGSKSSAFYEQLLTKMRTALDALVSKHTLTITALWGAQVATEGASIKKQTTAMKAKPNDPGTRTAAAKTAEQAKDMLPKTLATAQKQVTGISQFITREVAKVPEAFRRQLKPQIDAFRMEGLKVVAAQNAWETKYQKTMEVLAELERVLG